MPATWFALIVSALFCIVLATPGQAQTAKDDYPHNLSLGVWPTSVTTTSPPGSWSTFFWVLEYRYSSERLPWGLHLQYATGSQSGGGAGTDTMWSADVTYRFQTAGLTAQARALTVRGFAGYGSIETTSTITLSARSSGFRIGLDATYPLTPPAPGAGGWSLNAAVAHSPSNTVTGGVSTVGSRSATDWNVFIHYKTPSPPRAALTAATEPSAVITTAGLLAPGGHDFNFNLGFREVTFTGSEYRWSGVFFAIGKTF